MASSISHVAHPNTVYVTSTSVSVTSPSGIADGDGLLAIVFYQWAHGGTEPTLTAPSGWTEQQSGICHAHTGSYSSVLLSHRVKVYTKDTVTSGNSSTTYTWSHNGSSGRMGVSLHQFRSSFGTVTWPNRDGLLDYDNDASAWVVPAQAGLATGDEAAIIWASTILFDNTPNTFTPEWYNLSNPATLITNAPVEDNRITAFFCTDLASGYTPTGDNFSFCPTMFDYNSNEEPDWDELGAGGVVYGTINVGRTATDEPTLAETMTLAGFISGSVNGAAEFEETLADSMSFTNTTAYLKYLYSTLSDTATFYQSFLLANAFSVSQNETFTLTPSLAANWGVLVADTATLTEGIDDSSTQFQWTVAEAMSTLDAVLAGNVVPVSETVTLSETLASVQALAVLEALGITLTQDVSLIYARTVAETIALSDSLRNFFGMGVEETLTLTPTTAVIGRFTDTLSDTVTVTPAVTPTLILRVTAAEAFDISGDALVGQILTGTIVEEIDIGAAFVLPGSAFTTWAVNVRNGAVTEYADYVYNSFAKHGSRYIGASSSGIYELDGNTDAGADIVATLRTGFAQLGGSRFTGFKAAYLGMRGSGEVLLKLVEGDGTERTYQVAIRNMETTRVNIGKGLRARYFAFELETLDGIDFDLDTIEFVPMVADRRV